VIKFRTIVLVATFILAQVPTQRVKAQAAAIAVPVGAAIVIMGGISYYVWVNSQGERQAVPVPILEDPEVHQEEWDYPISADSQLEADRMCQQLAESNGVTLVQAKRRTARGKTYDCIFRTNN
jgi:hypothetical protein